MAYISYGAPLTQNVLDVYSVSEMYQLLVEKTSKSFISNEIIIPIRGTLKCVTLFNNLRAATHRLVDVSTQPEVSAITEVSDYLSDTDPYEQFETVTSTDYLQALLFYAKEKEDVYRNAMKQAVANINECTKIYNETQ